MRVFHRSHGVRRVSRRLVLVAALGSGLAACNSGVIEPGTSQEAGIPPTHAAAGFEPGAPLGDAPDDMAVAGASIPAPGGGELQVLFYAFSTTAAAAGEGGGGAGGLVPGSSDSNAASDVFVAAILNTSVVTPGGRQSVTFSQALAPIFRADRCITCHGARETPPTLSSDEHPGNFLAVRGCDANGCHVTGILPEGLDRVWSAPDGLDFRGKTDAELCEMATDTTTLFASLDEAVEHLKGDAKILWALTSGRVPESGPSGGQRPVPGISLEEWVLSVDLWADAGFQCDDSDALEDLVLVSRVAGLGGGAVAGDGPSAEPAVAYRADPAFNPDAALSRAGRLHVAFSSLATNLLPSASAPEGNVYVASYDVRVARDAEGVPSIALVFRRLDLASVPVSGSLTGGNARSWDPSIAAPGASWVAGFTTLATDLVEDFADGNGAGAPDVVVRDDTAGRTRLASPSLIDPAVGGNAASANASLAASGGAVAFESAASDLVPGDTNGVRDVFWAPLGGGGAGVPAAATARASVRTDGAEGTRGDCRNPSVQTYGDGVLVAFESDKVDLVTGLSEPGRTQIYVHESGSGVTATASRAGTQAGTGDSRRPQLGRNGALVVFETDAANLDVLRQDENRASDIVVADIRDIELGAAPVVELLSVSSLGEVGNGDSRSPVLGAFAGDAVVCNRDLLVAYRTDATNLGASENSGVLFAFPGGVEPPLPPDAPSRCAIAVTPPSPRIGEIAEFVASGTALSELGTEWDFDDGTVVKSPTDRATHAFTEAGTFTVLLGLNDGCGGCPVCTTDVTVESLPPACSIAVRFDATPVTPEDDLFESVEYSFVASASDPDPGDFITSHEWDFGDGMTASGPNASHFFSETGTFDVKLTVTDRFGQSATCERSVTVVPFVGNDPPSCTLSAVPGPVSGKVRSYVGDSVTFTANATDPEGQPVTFSWDFGDGSALPSGSATESHTFTTAAITRTVRVTVQDVPPVGLLPRSSSCTIQVAVGERFSTIAATLRTCGCHTTTTIPPVITGADDDDLFNELRVDQGWCSPTSAPLVKSRDPDGSLLPLTVSRSFDDDPPCGTRGMGPDASLANRLRTWIEAGAARN